MEEWITETVELLGYPGVALLMLLENIFPPIPSELVMPMAGFSSGRGELSFAGVVIAGTIGSVVGQLPWYFLGWTVGDERIKQWADRYGRWLALSRADVERAERWFTTRGAMTVFMCRLIPGVRTLISIPAGMARMNFGVFLFYSTAGMGLWATFLAYLGRLLGENYESVEMYIGPASTLVLAGGLVAGVLWLFWRRRIAQRLTAK